MRPYRFLKHRTSSRERGARGGGASAERGSKSAVSRGGERSGRGRDWLFRLAALTLLPLLALAMVEGGLRLIGFGHSTSFFKRTRIRERDVFVENDKFGLRFFAPELARSPAPVVMTAEKGAGTCRIFLFGESAALGDPRPAYGMGRYLEALLSERFPGTEFEVVCVAMTAINSHAVLPIARECVRHQGDLWVIYMGNNEMVGPFGAATVFGRQVPGWLSIRLTLALKSTRLGQALESLIRKWGKKSAGPWSGMGMFAEQQVAPDDPRRQIAHRHFARNLEAILRLAGKAGCPVVLSTVASNLRDCAPFASAHAASITPAAAAEFEALCQAAATHEAGGDLDAALASYRRAKGLDATYAELDFRLGHCLLRRTNALEAGDAFRRARDFDALPFRADSAINGLICEAAARHRGGDVRLVRAEEALGAQGAAGVPGAEFFFEHVHLNFAGNYRLGRLLAEAIEQSLPFSITRGRVAEWASQEACERRLGLTEWNRAGVLEDVLRRLQAAPFTRQANHQAQIDLWRKEWQGIENRLTPERAAEAQAVYLDALLRAPGDHRLHEGYAEFLEATGRHEEAGAQWRTICGLLPHHFAAYVHAGRLLRREEQWNAAETSLRKVLELEPRSGEGHLELGRVLAAQGKLDEALVEYESALRWQPGNASIYLHLANALAAQEKRGAAMEALAKAIRVQPSYWEAHYLLGVELAMSNRIPEARKEFEEVLRWRPNHVLAHINLGVALVKEGLIEEARRHFEEALRLDPQNRRAREHLNAIGRMMRGSGPGGP